MTLSSAGLHVTAGDRGGFDACAPRSDGPPLSRRPVHHLQRSCVGLTWRATADLLAPCHAICPHTPHGLSLNCYKDFTVVSRSSYKVEVGSHLESSGPDLSPHPPTTPTRLGPK